MKKALKFIGVVLVLALVVGIFYFGYWDKRGIPPAKTEPDPNEMVTELPEDDEGFTHEEYLISQEISNELYRMEKSFKPSGSKKKDLEAVKKIHDEVIAYLDKQIALGKVKSYSEGSDGSIFA